MPGQRGKGIGAYRRHRLCHPSTPTRRRSGPRRRVLVRSTCVALATPLLGQLPPPQRERVGPHQTPPQPLRVRAALSQFGLFSSFWPGGTGWTPGVSTEGVCPLPCMPLPPDGTVAHRACCRGGGGCLTAEGTLSPAHVPRQLAGDPASRSCASISCPSRALPA